MWAEIKRIFSYRVIITHLAGTELKAAHRHKFLGNLWALLDPLCMMVVLFFVFYHMMHRSYEYALFLFSGLIVWDFFMNNITNAATCIRRQKVLIHKVPLPMGIFPIATMLRLLNDFAWGVLAFIIMKLFTQVPIQSYATLLLLPVLLFFYCIFILGVSYIIAFLGVFLLDMPNVLGFVLRLGFFVNPIFWWPMETIPEKIHFIYYALNPVAGYLVYFRNILMDGCTFHLYEVPVPHYLLILIIVSIGTWVVGFSVFYLGQGHLAKYL